MAMLQALIFIFTITEYTLGSPVKIDCWNATEVEEEDLFVFGSGSDSSSISATSCAVVCGSWNMNYAGILDGTHCMCDDQLPSAGPSVGAGCDALCPIGNDTCGSDGYLLVYESLQTVEDFELRLEELLTDLLFPTAALVDLSFTPTDMVGMVYSLDDGTGVYEIVNASQFSHQIPLPGVNILTGLVCDSTQTKQAEDAIGVYMEASSNGFENITINCLSDEVQVYDLIECDVTIPFGTSINITDADGSNEWQIEGSSYNFIGPEFASEASLYQVGRKDFTIMMPLSEVQTPGYVTAFRLFGAAVGGIHIQIRKPVCADYCYWDQECGSYCDPVDQSCAVNDTFCQASDLCCDYASEHRFNKTKSINWLLHWSYQSFSLKLGPQILYLDEIVRVEPGYVLSYASEGTGALAQLTSLDQGVDYVNSGGGPSHVTSAGRHMLQAIISSGTIASLFREAEHDPGTLQISIDLLDLTTMNQTVLTTNITVLEQTTTTTSTTSTTTTKTTSTTSTTSTTANPTETISLSTTTPLEILTYTGTSTSSSGLSESTPTQHQTSSAALTGAPAPFSPTATSTVPQAGSTVTVGQVATSAPLATILDTSTVSAGTGSTAAELVTTTIQQETTVTYSLEIITYRVLPFSNVELNDNLTISWSLRSSQDVTCSVSESMIPQSLHNSTYSNCDSTCTDSIIYKVIDLSSDLNISISCVTSDEFAGDYVIVTALQQPNSLTILNPVCSSAQPNIVQFKTGGVPIDDFDIILETDIGVLTLTPTYNPNTDTYSITLPQMTEGNYLLSITATNSAGSIQSNYTLYSLDPIAGFVVSTVYGDVDPNSGTPLEITGLTFEEATNTTGFDLVADIQGGSNVTIYVDWGDGTPVFETSPPLDLNHIYSTGGDYSVIVTADSPLDDPSVMEIDLIVVNPLPDEGLLSIELTDSIYTEEGTLAVGYQITYDDSNGPLQHIPNQVHLSLLGGDSNSLAITPMVIGETYYYEYDVANSVDVVAFLTNSVGDNVTLYQFIDLSWPITDMHLLTTPAHAIPDQMVGFSVLMLRGDNVMVTWDFGDGTPNVTKPFDSSSQLTTESHSYTNLGVYDVTVSAENSMGGIVMFYTINIQKPILTDMFLVITNSPVEFPDPVTLTVIYNGSLTDYPNNVTIEILTGDGQVIQMDLSGETNLTFVLNTTKPGEYQGHVTISNLATRVDYDMEVATVELIENVTLGIMWKPDLPRSAAPKPGIGQDGNVFPISYPVMFDIGYVKGSPISYVVEAVNEDTGVVETFTFDDAPFYLPMTEPGNYNVTVTATNALSSISVSQPLVLQGVATGSAENLRDTGNSTTRPREVREFELDTQSDCVECCVSVNYGDGSPTEYYSYSDGGDTNHCGNNTLAGYVQNTSLILSHIYETSGQYMVTVTQYNPFSTQTFSKPVSVSTRDCSQPSLSIDDRKSFLEAEKWQRSSMSTTLARTGLVCSDTLVNAKLWRFYKVDEDTGDRKSEIDVSSINTHTTAQLVVPPRFLDYGFYELEYSVSMTKAADDVPFASTVSTFIEVIRSELIMRVVYGGLSKITRGVNQSVALDVEKYSIDPDKPAGEKPDLTEFYWFCRRVGEEIPTDSVTGDYLLSPVYQEQNSKTVSFDKGGCYGSGTGRLDLHTGSIEISTELLIVGFTYELVVQVVSSDNRTGIASLMVEIVSEAYIPIISIRCADGGVCRQTQGGQQVNPTNRLAMYAECFSPNCLAPITYNWKISYLDQYNFWRRIVTDQDYIEGTNSRGIGISKTLFEDFPDITQFEFRLNLGVQVGTAQEQSGQAWMNVKINTKPYGGWCYVTPKYASSSAEPFFVNCYNWLDDTAIDRFEIYARYKNGTKLMYYDRELKDVRLYLPYGDQDEQYLIDLEVKVIDEDKAFTLYSMGYVRVERPSISVVYDDLAAHVFTDSHEIDVVLQGGDIQAVSEEIIRMSGTISDITTLVSATFADDASSAGQYIAEGVADTDFNSYDMSQIKVSMNVTADTSQEQAYNTYEDFRNQAAEVMKKMMTSLNNVGTGSVESLLLVSSALSTATAVYPVLSRDAQSDSMKLCDRLVSQLLDRTADSTQEQLEEVAGHIIATITSTFQGANMQLDSPISGDYEYARTVWDYDTNLYSDDPWLDAGGTLDQTLNNLQNFTSNKLQKQTSQKVVSSGMNNMQIVSESLLKNMVPGEKPVKYNQGAVDMYISKEVASKLSSRTYNGQGATITVPDYCDLRPQDCVEADSAEQIVIAVSSSSLSRNPFIYDSKTENYKDPSASVGVKSVSRDSGSTALEYYDEAGNKLSIKDTLAPIHIMIPNSQTPTSFIRKTVPDGRSFYLVNELISVETANVSLVVEFANVTDYDYLAVFLRYDERPNLVTNEFDAVYQIDVASGPEPGTYLGCYQDNDVARAMNGSGVYTFGSASSAGICRGICEPQKYKYAGVRDGVDCYCANSYSRYGILPDMECNITCPGNLNENCGGIMKLSVYTTGYTDPTGPAIIMMDENVIEGRTGTFYVSFAPLQLGFTSINETDDYRSILEPNATFSYSVRSSTVGCYWFNEETTEMTTEGCKVGSGSSSSMVECYCNHLTNFAGGWVVAPNTIDFTSLNFDPTENPVIYITISIIAALYIMLAIWARRADRKDMSKLGTIVMDSNDPLDKYLYELQVNTGSRKEGGTKSKVFLLVAGDQDETEVRPLNSVAGRAILKRGQQDSFLMAVPRPLGQLQYLRVWHDNSGRGDESSWFLNYITLKDLQTGSKFHFVANRWLAIDEDDGEIDRIIPIAGDEDMLNFSHLFAETSKRNFSDDHLWFSIFTRPPTSRFTRLQRVSCCLLLLMLSMVTSAMFYEKDSDSTGGLKIGPLTLTPEQVAIGFYTNLIVFAVSLIVIQMFRKSRLRYKRPSMLKEAVKQNQIRSAYYMPSYAGASNVSQTDFITAGTVPGGSGRDSSAKEDGEAKKKRPFMFPWWCRVIAWIILWLAVIACTTFTFLYSIDFGNDKTSKWLTSMIVSFLSSVFITQPVKVILVAVIFSLIVKNPNMDVDEEWLQDEEEFILKQDEQWLHQENQGYAFKPSMKFGRKPFNQKILSSLREKRRKEVAMYTVIREIVLYCTFVSILVVLSAGVQNVQSFTFKRHLTETFVKSGDRSFNDFMKIRNESNFWYWTRNTLIPGLRASEWYNGEPPVGLRGFLSDHTSRIMGYAVMRQLRTPINTCGVPEQLVYHIRECVDAYDIWNDEKKDYGPYWNEDAVDSTYWPEYIHRTAAELDGLPYIGEVDMYGGNGYVFELNKATDELINKTYELEQQAWIDRYTRAVFIEFTVYNPGTNLFSINTMLLEKPHSGSYYPIYRFSPMKLLSYVGNTAIFEIACHVMFGMFIFGFMIHEIRKVIREGREYFKELWSYIEMTIIFLALLSTCLYVVQYVMIRQITEKFRITKGNAYMKFEYVKAWSEVYIYVFSLLVFFTIIKFIKLLRFNKKMLLLAETLRHCGKNLALFSIVFGIVFFSFVQFFHIILLQNMLAFVTFWRSWMTSFAMMLGRFDFQRMTRSNSLAPIFFILFMVVNMFILLNMLLSIVIESFTAVKNELAEKKNDHEIIEFILNRFKSWTGLNKNGEKTDDPESIVDDSDGEEVGDLVGQFPVRIELLLSSLKKCYIEGIMYTAADQQRGGSAKRRVSANPSSRAKQLKLRVAKGLLQ